MSKEAEYVQSKLGRAKSIHPNYEQKSGQKAKLKLKKEDGTEVVHEIPILTGKDCF